MKNILSILFIVLVSLSSSAADFEAFTKLFEKVALPYTVPEGAFMDYGNEEFEPPFSGTDIPGELSVAFLEAQENGYTQYEAVARIEQPNYIGFVVFETSVNMNSGAVSGMFVLYNLSKTGEYISSTVIAQNTFGNEENFYETYRIGSVISNSEWTGDEKKLQIAYSENIKKAVMDGKYGMEQEMTTVFYDLIEEDGKINSVTSKFDE